VLVPGSGQYKNVDGACEGDHEEKCENNDGGATAARRRWRCLRFGRGCQRVVRLR